MVEQTILPAENVIKPICQATCRDDTPCLNRAQYGNFCWKHKNESR